MSESRTIPRQVAKSQRSVLIGAIGFLFSLVLAAFGLVLIVYPFGTGTTYTIITIGTILLSVFVFVLSLYLFARGLSVPSETPGLPQVIEALNYALDGRYVIFRLLRLPGGKHADAVVVGPTGVLVLNLVSWRGIYRNDGDSWQVRESGSDFRLTRENPSRELLQQVQTIREMLAGRQLFYVPVYALIVFTEKRVNLSMNRPVVPVVKLADVTRIVESGYMQGEMVQPPVVKNVIKTFRSASR